MPFFVFFYRYLFFLFHFGEFASAHLVNFVRKGERILFVRYDKHGGAAMAATVLATLGKIALGTVISAALSLIIGGVIAGICATRIGNGFWNAFADHVQDNALDALITSFAFSAVSVAIGNIVQFSQCFKEGTLVETEDGLKPIEDIKVGDKVLAYDEKTGAMTKRPVNKHTRK